VAAASVRERAERVRLASALGALALRIDNGSTSVPGLAKPIIDIRSRSPAEPLAAASPPGGDRPVTYR
jgi:GrpB-like predicted nucleotidyltransferase (UPF0157 family)